MSSFCAKCGDAQYRTKYNAYACNFCREHKTVPEEETGLEYAIKMLDEAKESTKRTIGRLDCQPQISTHNLRLARMSLKAARSYTEDALAHLLAAEEELRK